MVGIFWFTHTKEFLTVKRKYEVTVEKRARETKQRGFTLTDKTGEGACTPYVYTCTLSSQAMRKASNRAKGYSHVCLYAKDGNHKKSIYSKLFENLLCALF